MRRGARRRLRRATRRRKPRCGGVESGVPVSFAFPALLYGAAAAGAPLLIHLLLRPRPRRQVFPALRLLRASHEASIRRHRVSQWLVLLVRTLLILSAVAAAARPSLRLAGLGDVPRGPTRAVLCIDDSASMMYQKTDHTRLDTAWELARTLTQDAERFPAGSRFLLLTGSRRGAADWQDSAAALWSAARANGASAAARRAPPLHDRGVLRLIGDARQRLAEAGQDAGEIYVFCDLTRRAFEGAMAAERAARSPAIYIVDCGDAENRNRGISVARVSGTGGPADGAGQAWITPAGAPSRIEVAVTAGDAPFEGQADVWLDGQLATRSAPLSAPAHTTAAAVVVLPVLSPGVHRGEVRLDGADALPADDAAYFALQVAPRAKAAVVSGRADAATQVESRRVAALLAPDSLSADRRPYVVDVRPPDWPRDGALDEYRFLAWIEPGRPAVEQVARLRAWCERGGSLLVICGPDMPPWPTSDALGAQPIGVASPRGGARFVVTGDQAEDALPDLSFRGRRVDRYVQLAQAAGARAAMRFDDQSPAMLEQAIGRGRVTWWAFSMRPDWSDLGARAAPVLARLQRLAAASAANEARAFTVWCDDPLSLPFEIDPRASVRIERMAGAGAAAGDSSVEEARTALSTPAASSPSRRTLATSAAGLFRIEVDGATAASYAVNLRPAETDGQRMSADAVWRLLQPDAVQVVRDLTELRPSATPGGERSRDLEGWLWLLALALLGGEAALLRRPSASPRGASRPAMA